MGLLRLTGILIEAEVVLAFHAIGLLSSFLCFKKVEGLLLWCFFSQKGANKSSMSRSRGRQKTKVTA